MVNSKIILRVLRIKFGDSLGTAFTIERKGTQYLVTAKHLFEDKSFPCHGIVSLLLDKKYYDFTADIRYPVDDKIDIAVVKLNPYRKVTQEFDNQVSLNGVFFGQDVYFLGFPFEYDAILSRFPNHTRPVPFIKKACFSAMTEDGKIVYLDGINNPGFSGGPVCFENKSTGSISILGVISGYRIDEQPLYTPNDEETHFYVESNSGIIVVSSIEPAVEVADNWKD